MKKNLIILSCYLFFFSDIRAQLAGDLDSTFSFDGYSTTYYNSNGSFTDVAIQTDGKIIGTGHTSNNEMVSVRYNSNGSLDNTFGVGGVVYKYFGSIWPRFNELQSDGKLLIAGVEFITSYVSYNVLRYNSNGTIDSTFDSDGEAVIFPGLVSNSLGDMKIQPDGKILLAGTCDNGTQFHDISILRLNIDGSIDSTFDNDGFAKVSSGAFYPNINTMAVQSDGKIVIGGNLETGGIHKYILVRFNANGSIDSTFNDDGIAQTVTLADNYFKSIALQPDGKIVALGDIQLAGGKDFFLARFKPNGSLDSIFGSNGFIATDFNFTNDFAYDVSIQTDHKIVVTGYTTNPSSYYCIAIARYDSIGTLDINFGTYGKVTNLLGQFSTSYACDLQNDGKIIIAGSQLPLTNNNQYFLVARYLAESTVGMNNYEKEDKVLIYPNPFDNHIIIEMEKKINEQKVFVLDLYGRLIMSKSFDNNIKLDLVSVQSGLYFIQIVDKDGKMKVFKMIKK